MSQIDINPDDLAYVIKRILTEPDAVRHLDSSVPGEELFPDLMSDLAEVMCNYCGGEIMSLPKKRDILSNHTLSLSPTSHGKFNKPTVWCCLEKRK